MATGGRVVLCGCWGRGRSTQHGTDEDDIIISTQRGGHERGHELASNCGKEGESAFSLVAPTTPPPLGSMTHRGKRDHSFANIHHNENLRETTPIAQTPHL